MTAILVGCGAGSTPRMIDLVGKDAFPSRDPLSEDHEWKVGSKVGLMVHSDATAPNAAPAIMSGYLETLSRRTEEFLRRRCSLQEVVTVPPLSGLVPFSLDLKVQVQRLQLPYLIVVVFSSRERVGPEKIGEATMMTQMGGTVIENSAMAEVGILRMADFKMVFLAQGSWTESLEQLDVPIGSSQLSPTDAREILRARSGQHALDWALDHLGSACQSGLSGRSDFIGSFRIEGRVQSPAL